MSRYLFRLADIGEGVAEAEIVEWHVKPGDVVEEDQTLVDVMTDKATVDLTSPVRGVVISIHGDVGGQAPVGSTLIELEVEGLGSGETGAEITFPKHSVADEVLPSEPVALKAVSRSQAVKPDFAATQATAVVPVARQPGEEPLAAPATRRRAYERGIPLQFVPGTGPGGRITPDDLDAWIGQGGIVPVVDGPAKRTAIHEQKIIGLRRKIAEKMQESKRRIPHFGFVEEFDLTELEGLRAELNSERGDGVPKLTLLPFFMRAIALLRDPFPQINAHYDDEAQVLYQHEGVHMGIATQSPGGLMVPVVRHVEALDIWGCARELTRVTRAARDGTASREELSGSTITITSLGVLGGISATPIINAPEVAIIGPNKLVERPVVRNGQIVVRTLMNVSSAFDHRIVDGHDAASFIQRLRHLIERPALIFMERP